MRWGAGVEKKKTRQSNYTRLEVKMRSVQDEGKGIFTKKNINDNVHGATERSDLNLKGTLPFALQ